MSRSLSKSELNYSTTEMECLAVIAAVQHFKHYLYGRTFTVYGDHEPLTWIDSIKDLMSRLNRWRARLSSQTRKTKDQRRCLVAKPSSGGRVNELRRSASSAITTAPM